MFRVEQKVSRKWRASKHDGGGRRFICHRRAILKGEVFPNQEIRDLTYKQTAAFDQFLIYTHLAGRDYKHAAGERGSGSSVDSTQNTLLNINPEGNLLKEVKDIVDEILIMVRIKEQQQKVMEGLVKNVKRAMLPVVRGRSGRSSSQEWDVTPESANGDHKDGQTRPDEKAGGARQTLQRADNLLVDLSERTAELRGLLQIAQHTSAAISTSPLPSG